VHPAFHNKNLLISLNGGQIELTGQHAKVRRDGYRHPSSATTSAAGGDEFQTCAYTVGDKRVGEYPRHRVLRTPTSAVAGDDPAWSQLQQVSANAIDQGLE
jgi:hypothetical protein